MVLYQDSIDITNGSVKQPRGFAIDFGGSLIKVAYVADKTEQPTKDHVRIHLATFVRDDLDLALGFIKERCTLPSADQEPVEVTTTGVGCHQYGAKIGSTLNVKCNNTAEMICFVRAFVHLIKNLPLSDLLHPPSPAAHQFLEDAYMHKAAMKERLSKSTFELGQEVKDTTLDIHSKPTQVLPTMLYMLGSAGVMIKVNEDGTHTYFDVNPRCGKMFLGLGNLLVGTKNFMELISLAAAGDSKKLDIYLSDIKQHKEGMHDDVYGAIADNILTYCFGKAVHTDIASLEKEDIARALVSTISLDLVQSAMLATKSIGMTHMFLCGTFPDSHEVIRDELMRHYIRRTINFDQLTGKVDMYFMKYGGYLGVIGALLNNMLK